MLGWVGNSHLHVILTNTQVNATPSAATLEHLLWHTLPKGDNLAHTSYIHQLPDPAVGAEMESREFRDETFGRKSILKVQDKMHQKSRDPKPAFKSPKIPRSSNAKHTRKWHNHIPTNVLKEMTRE